MWAASNSLAATEWVATRFRPRRRTHAQRLHLPEHGRIVLGRRRAFPLDAQCRAWAAPRSPPAGTPEQKERFLKRFTEGKPKWGAMAITEPGCGSDSAAVTTTATREGDYWVLNGTKIFCTSGQMAAEKSEGFVVVWATVDQERRPARHQTLRGRA